MFEKSKYWYAAAAALALTSCGEAPTSQSDAVDNYRYSEACEQYASWQLEAQETRRAVELSGGNPNGDFLYENQMGAAQRAWREVTDIERENPELHDSGQCEKAIVHYLYTSRRL